MDMCASRGRNYDRATRRDFIITSLLTKVPPPDALLREIMDRDSAARLGRTDGALKAKNTSHSKVASEVSLIYRFYNQF